MSSSCMAWSKGWDGGNPSVSFCWKTSANSLQQFSKVQGKTKNKRWMVGIAGEDPRGS